MLERGWRWAWVGLAAFLITGCGLEPDRAFERNAPEVDRAIEALDAGQAEAAAELLQGYLGTGRCEKGEIGVSDLARQRKNASFDLGLTLFEFAEKYGARFGEKDTGAADAGPTPEQQAQMQLRQEKVTCALALLRAVGASGSVPPDLAARARYLEGNLEFLRGNYRDAVRAYDESLRLIPGIAEDAGGDPIGRDAAWNRAIALRRIQEQENEKDAGKDAPEDQDASQDAQPDSGSPDGGQDGPQEAGEDGPQDAPPPDAGNDGPSDGGDGKGDAGKDAGQDGSSPEDQNKEPDAGAPDGGQQPPPEPVSQDERVLDMLEAAPTVQFEDARRKASRRRLRGMVDK